MIGLLSLLLRLVLLAGFTFGFVVLFEHGPKGFAAGAPVELSHFENFLASVKNRYASPAAPTPSPAVEPAPAAPVQSPAPAPPTPAATPVPISAPAAPPKPKGPPSAWEQLQAKPIGEGIDLPVATPIPADTN